MKTQFFLPKHHRKFIFLCIFGVLISNVYAHVYTATNSEALRSILLKAHNGDTVLLTAKVYKGNFIINKSIKLLSKKKNIPTLTSDTGSTLSVHASNVLINGIHFINHGTSLSDKDSCIYVHSKVKNIQITHNSFSKCLYAIWLNASQNSYIAYNTISGRTYKLVSNRGNDIQLWNTKNTLLEFNTITKGRDGIYISNSTKVMVRNNKMKNVRFGVHFMYNNHCTFHNNFVSQSQIGLALMYSVNLTITNNIIKLNRAHGYLLRQVNDSKIINNQAYQNADGLFLGGSYSNLIQGNTFSYNKYGVIITSGSKLNKVFNNNFINNTMQAKYLNNSSLYWGWKGRGNYWSNHKSFKSVNGVGVFPYHVTDIADWLIVSYPILNLVFNSPVMTSMKEIENEFPIFQRAALIDKYPLVHMYAIPSNKKSHLS